jgi:hypothetical protein
MRVRRRFGALLAMTLIVMGLAAPPPAVACSCAMPRPLAEYGQEPTAVIVVGRVGPRMANGYAFQVERWYAGIAPTAIITMVPGDGASCGIGLHSGQHIFTVAFRDEKGLVNPSLCSPSADVESVDGQAYIAEADRIFGGIAVPGAKPEPQPPPGAALSGPLPAVAGAGGLALIGLLLIALRRQPTPS